MVVVSKIENLDKLLSETFCSDVKVLEQNISQLTAPGEHYGSIMLAVDISIKESGIEKDLHLVAKLIPNNSMLQAAFDIPVTFKKEAFAYTDMIPALVGFQKEYDVPRDKWLDKLFPKCYGARINLLGDDNQVDENGVILFENLKVKGYKTDDRLKGLGLDASKIIVSDLARIHAVPIAMRKLKPKIFESKVMPAMKKNNNFESVAEVRMVFQESIIQGAGDVEELEPYLGKLKKLIEYHSENLYKDRLEPNELFGTYSHTDYWVSNTMILRDDKGRAISNKMIDLQMATYSSAVRDLLFFLFTSVKNDVLDDYCDKLINIYYDSFIETLKDFHLDVSMYSWEAFAKELNQVAPSEVYHILAMLKPICTEDGKLNRSNSEFQDDDWKRPDLLGAVHRRKLRDTVLALAKKNWI